MNVMPHIHILRISNFIVERRWYSYMQLTTFSCFSASGKVRGEGRIVHNVYLCGLSVVELLF